MEIDDMWDDDEDLADHSDRREQSMSNKLSDTDLKALLASYEANPSLLFCKEVVACLRDYEQLKSWQESSKRYLRHGIMGGPVCQWLIHNANSCTCGLDDLLKQSQPQPLVGSQSPITDRGEQ